MTGVSFYPDYLTPAVSVETHLHCNTQMGCNDTLSFGMSYSIIQNPVPFRLLALLFQN